MLTKATKWEPTGYSKWPGHQYVTQNNSNYSVTKQHEFKCNLKELTTKSARVPRSAVFGMRMPGGWLPWSCDSLARSVFPSCWVLSPIFFVFLGVFLLYERFVTVVVDFANFFFVFFPSVSSKVGSTCLATRWTACRLRLTRPVPRRLRVMNPPRQPHQIPLLRPPLPRRPLRSQSQRRLWLRPSPRLFSSRYLRCWRPFGRTARQILSAVRQAIPARPLSRPACRRLIHRLWLRVVHRL